MTAKSYAVRQVFDLPEPQPLIVTEHRSHACLCGQCGKITKAKFPVGVKAAVQYGPRIAGVVTYLQCVHFMPEHRLAQIMTDLFQTSLVPATLAAMIRKTAKRHKEVASHLQDLIAQQISVKHLDETGFRVGGLRRWLHVICTKLLAFYRVASNRGGAPFAVTGCIVHDHWPSYFKLDGVTHALCNAHHLRELQALIDIDAKG